MTSAPFGRWERQQVDPVFSILGIGQPNTAATEPNTLCAAIASARDASWEHWASAQSSSIAGGYSNYLPSQQPAVQFGNYGGSHFLAPQQTPLQMFQTQRRKMEIPSFDEVGEQTPPPIPGDQPSAGLFKENTGSDVDDRIKAMFASAGPDKCASMQPMQNPGLYEVTNYTAKMPAINPFEQLKAAIAPLKPYKELSITAPEFVPHSTVVNDDVTSPEASKQSCFAPPPEENAVTTLPSPESSLGPLFDETMQRPQSATQAPVGGPAELLLRRLSREFLLACRPKPDSSEQEGLCTVSMGLLSASTKKHIALAPPGLDGHSPTRAKWQPKASSDQWQ